MGPRGRHSAKALFPGRGNQIGQSPFARLQDQIRKVGHSFASAARSAASKGSRSKSRQSELDSSSSSAVQPARIEGRINSRSKSAKLLYRGPCIGRIPLESAKGQLCGLHGDCRFATQSWRQTRLVGLTARGRQNPVSRRRSTTALARGEPSWHPNARSRLSRLEWEEGSWLLTLNHLHLHLRPMYATFSRLPRNRFKLLRFR